MEKKGEQLRLAEGVIKKDEIEMAMRKMKNRKNSGCNGLPV